jgi:hypothetical protein
MKQGQGVGEGREEDRGTLSFFLLPEPGLVVKYF